MKIQTEQLRELFKKPSPLILGVCNLTPDSFSDGGLIEDRAAGVDFVQTLFKNGSDIVDIGGEASGPGSSVISEEEELQRIIGVVKGAAGFGPLSIDTYKASVARSCINSGASIINDISALRADPEMVNIARETGCYVILMFSKEKADHPQVSNSPGEYKNLLATIESFLSERIEFALSSGLEKEKLILDPGMGAFISPEAKYSWELLDRFEMLVEKFREFPLMVATSRKGFLDIPLAQRDPISQYTAMLAVDKGARLIRTHNPQMAANFIETRRKIPSFSQ